MTLFMGMTDMRFSQLPTMLAAALALSGCSERQQDPVTSGPLYQFTNGQSVQTTTAVTVHSAANNFSSSVGTKPAGVVGTIQASPGTKDATGDNTIYWQVTFTGLTGWVSGVFLTPAP